MDPQQQELVKWPGSYVVAIFGSYLGTQLLLFPFLVSLYYAYYGKVILEEPLESRLQLAAMIIASLAVFFVYFRFTPFYRNYIWHKGHPFEKKRMVNLLLGVTIAIIVYPLVLLFSGFVNLLIEYFSGIGPQEQDVVSFFKQTESDPLLMGGTILMIVFVVPMIEELLFRGNLQCWLIQYCGKPISIAITSFIFALFHFSFEQGLTNISLVASLWVLGCCLGYLYEKRGSLWASIGLHMAFNGISVLMILLMPEM